MTPLHWAAAGGSAQLVKVMLDAGANIHAAGRGGGTPLHEACTHARDGAAAALLFRRGAIISRPDAGGMHRAAHVGNTAAVEALLRNGAFVDVQRQSDGATALYFAAWIGDLQMMRLLLGARAAVDPKGNPRAHR